MSAPLSRLLSAEAIVAMAGHETYARGMVYARMGKVHDVTIDVDRLTVTGRVEGSHRKAYATLVQLVGDEDGWTSNRGRCSCPVALDCKHAAALLIVARAMVQSDTSLNRPTWQRSLDRLIRTESAPATEVVPLGLEFEVERTPSYRGQPTRIHLRVRPVRRGKSGKWVRSGISWDELDFTSLDYREDQRDLLLQIRGAAGATARYSYPKSPWLSLGGVSGGVWTLLRTASAGALSLVTAGLDHVPPHLATDPAQVRLDASTSDGGLLLAPQVLLGGEPLDLEHLGFLGDPAHGLFLDHGRGSTVTLARLEEPLTKDLRQLVTDRQPVQVPAADRRRFVTEYLPALRRRALVTSADSTVDLPEPVSPTLCLAIQFRPEHRLRLDWGFSYPMPDGVRRFAAEEEPTRPSVRDAAAEQRLLNSVPLPYDRLPQLRDSAGQMRPAPSALLADLQTVFFLNQVLPGLEAAGVEVTVSGEVIDYRRVDATPQVEVSTSDAEDSSDWFDLRIQVRLEGEEIPFEQLFVALSSGEEFLILETGVYLPLDVPELDQLRALIDEARTLTDREPTELRITRYQVSLWEELVQLGVVIEQSDRWSKTVSGLGDITATDPVEPPAGLRAELRPYQVEGYRWLSFLWTHGLGGVLADDMGLGKTVQNLAMILRAREQEPDAPPFLVVAPTSVVANWAQEAARFTPGLRVVGVEQTESKRKTLLSELVAGADVVVTSYTLLRLDEATYAGRHWSGLILDEAQFVKNYRAKTYGAARRVSAPFKLAITGTPLENSLMDLWSLLSITAPGLFPHPERFAEFYARPIERSGHPDLLAQLRRRVRPVLLRRTKESVAADLPPKQEQVLEVVLEPRHQRVYAKHLQRERQKVLGLIEDLDKNRFTILRSLTLLRQLALDPSLVSEEYAGVPATKADVLAEHLAEIVEEGHRVLVFSQFTSFLATIRRRLDTAGISYAYLDGRTRNRERVVSGFRSGDQPVFLISLKAGGFGLNLTEADYCFVLDPWWNPAVEAQAVDRTHRIGQTRTVMVYRLVAKDTIEEKVMELKSRKSRLFAAVTGEDALGGGGLDADDIRGLLGLPG